MLPGPPRGTRAFRKDDSILKHRIAPGTFRRIGKFARPYAGTLAFFLGLVVFNAAIGVVNPLIYRELINRGILTGNSGLVIGLALLAAGIAVADAGLTFAKRHFATRVGLQIVLDLRQQVFAHIQGMSMAFFSRTRTGALISRLNNDVSGVRDAFTDILSTALGNIVTTILVLAAMFTLSWRLTLASLLLVPLFFIPARWVGHHLRQLTRERYNRNAELNNFAVERLNVAGAMLVKIFGRPGEEVTMFGDQARRVRDVSLKASNYSRMLFAGLGLMASLAVAVVYGWGGLLTVRGALDVGTLVALVSYLMRLYGPMTALSSLQVDVMTALVSFERVFEILDLEPMVKERPGARDIPPGPIRLEFDRVSFRYPLPSEVSLASLETVAVLSRQQEQPVLHEISFTAEAGKRVALVGPSGAGKSTIAQLAARLYDPRAGVVRMNGLDLRDATDASIRRAVGMVMQDTHLFHDTLRANLLYARPGASEAELIAALRDAQIWSVVQSLPQGLDTVIGERGHRLSGGERQRVAIARLLLKAPPLVILDEATAHLDSESERAIQQAFATALAGRTSLVIAHRLSTVLHADLILVLDRGRIVEQGRHEELIATGQLYAQLYHTQFQPREMTALPLA